jgi:hypothetical protein
MILSTFAALSASCFRLASRDSAPLVEQEACIEGLQELQDVMQNLGRPLVRCDVWGLCRLYDGHEAGLFSSSSAAGVGSVAHNLRRGLGVTTRGS